MANDTSFGVGHAPLTETETIVYEAEHELNTTYHADHPELGPDVKIMGKREGDRIDITVAAAMVDRYVDGLDEYDDAVENVREFVTELAESRTDREVHVDVNTADDYDEGSVSPHRHRHLRGAGRRRVRGTRQTARTGSSLEPAPCPWRRPPGRTPSTTSGRSTTSCRPGSRSPSPRRSTGSATCRSACSQIGRPIDEPHVADAQLVTEDGVALRRHRTEGPRNRRSRAGKRHRRDSQRHRRRRVDVLSRRRLFWTAETNDRNRFVERLSPVACDAGVSPRRSGRESHLRAAVPRNGPGRARDLRD